MNARPPDVAAGSPGALCAWDRAHRILVLRFIFCTSAPDEVEVESEARRLATVVERVVETEEAALSWSLFRRIARRRLDLVDGLLRTAALFQIDFLVSEC